MKFLITFLLASLCVPAFALQTQKVTDNISASVGLDDWLELGEVTDQLENSPQFKHSDNFNDWHRRNISRTYLQLEMDQ